MLSRTPPFFSIVLMDPTLSSSDRVGTRKTRYTSERACLGSFEAGEDLQQLRNPDHVFERTLDGVRIGTHQPGHECGPFRVDGELESDLQLDWRGHSVGPERP